MSAVIAGCVSAGVVTLVVIVVVIAVSVFLISNKKYKKTDSKVGRVCWGTVEDDGEPDGIEHASTHTLDERERLLRQRTTVQRDVKNRLVLDYLQELPLLGGYNVSIRPLKFIIISPSNDHLILPS